MPCEWNKHLELQNFLDNIDRVGFDSALEISRANARSYRAEREGRAFRWELVVDPLRNDMLMSNGKHLLDSATREPISGENADIVSERVKAAVPYEAPTLELAVERALAGDRVIVFPEHYVGDNGDNDVLMRFFTIWVQDPNNSRLYHGRRIDIGRDAVPDEATAMLSERLGLSDRKGVRVHQDETQKFSFVISLDKLDNSVLCDPIQTVDTDVQGEIVDTSLRWTTRPIDDRIHQRIDHGETRAEEPPTPEASATGEKRFRYGRLTPDFGNEDVVGASRQDEAVENTAVWLKRVEEALDISPARAQELFVQLEEAWETVEGAREVIAFAADPETQGVAVPAALFALDVLAHPETQIGVNGSIHEQFEYGLEERGESGGAIKLSPEKWEAVIAFFFSDEEANDLFELTQLPAEQTSRPNADSLELIHASQESDEVSTGERIDVVVLTWVKECIMRVDRKPKEEAVQSIEHEEHIVLLHMGELWEAFIALVDAHDIHDGERNTVIAEKPADADVGADKKNHPSTVKEKRLVNGLSVAFAVWLLLKCDSYIRALAALTQCISTGSEGAAKDTSRGIREQIRAKRPEGLIQKEPAQWLLLAIIWYLAQIRESCTAGSNLGRKTNKNQPRKRKKKKIAGGIIYSHAVHGMIIV